ncbi:MAG: DNA polymerase III subunit alpha [Planctomycetes bacterium]|nr:DNA polymerase III subunit alpha [Planctomycetota bacterium]
MRARPFAILDARSAYSLLAGNAPVERLVERAAAMGCPALAIADADNLYGAPILRRAARIRGLRPIIAAAITAPAPPGRGAVVIARDRPGYESLCRVITARRLEPAFDIATGLAGLSGGVFVLTEDPDLAAALVPRLGRDAVRIAIVRPGRSESGERRRLDAAEALGIRVAADPAPLYIDPGDRDAAIVLAAAREGTVATRAAALVPPGRHIPGPREMAGRYRDIPDAIDETVRIAEACEDPLPDGTPIFPRAPLADGERPFARLWRLAHDGLARRAGPIDAAAARRLAEELAIIERQKFVDYFLVVGDIVREARARGIAVVGRGSGASSIVAYALGVTNVDPLAHGLAFERFLHPARADLPDLDIDLCWRRRDEVIEYVYATYGAERVAMISTHNFMGPRSAFREAAKAHGIPVELVDRLAKRIPYGHEGPLRDILSRCPEGRGIDWDADPYRAALARAGEIEGLPRHLGIHPGGIVIGDRPLAAYVPLERAAKGIVVTQYDMRGIEEIGLVKIDLLGNRCLTEIQEAGRTLAERGIAADIERIPDADPRAADLIASGRTIGCFQLESPAMRNLLKMLRPRAIRDVIVAVALIRPGPAEGGMKEAYVRRARGEEPPAYAHPSLRPALEESFGVLLYEEDVMRAIAALTGMSLADADTLRRRIKKAGGEELEALEDAFLERAVRAGVAPGAARGVWREVARFTRYAFNKAHAAGYGTLAYQAAYLKAHHPLDFLCAVLNNHAGMYERETIVEEVRRAGVTILAPCVNRSGRAFRIEGGAIRTPLALIKGLAGAVAEAIEAERPFASLNDLVRRVPMSRPEAEALVLSGALDRMGPNRPQHLWELAATFRRERGAGALPLAAPAPRYPPLAPFPVERRIELERRHLGFSPSGHPMRIFREDARRAGCVPAAEAVSSSGRIRVAGLIAASRGVRTRRAERMRFISLEDETGVIEAVVFPNVLPRVARRLEGPGPHILEGAIEARAGVPALRVGDVGTLRRAEGPLPVARAGVE